MLDEITNAVYALGPDLKNQNFSGLAADYARGERRAEPGSPGDLVPGLHHCLGEDEPRLPESRRAWPCGAENFDLGKLSAAEGWMQKAIGLEGVVANAYRILGVGL